MFTFGAPFVCFEKLSVHSASDKLDVSREGKSVEVVYEFHLILVLFQFVVHHHCASIIR